MWGSSFPTFLLLDLGPEGETGPKLVVGFNKCVQSVTSVHNFESPWKFVENERGKMLGNIQIQTHRLLVAINQKLWVFLNSIQRNIPAIAETTCC